MGRANVKPHFIYQASSAYPPVQDYGKVGAYPSCHGARGRVHPGQAGNLLQGEHRETDNHSQLWAI